MEPLTTFEHNLTNFPENKDSDEPCLLGDGTSPDWIDQPNLQRVDAAERMDIAPDARCMPLQRAIDIVFAACTLLLILPLSVLIAVAIKIDSPGPILFSQERVGLRGKRFRLYKFRSMGRDAERLQARLWSDNERSGPVFKIKNDPRITRVGRYMRRYSIDELPQFINVLRGEMSLVGPRPALPYEVAMYTPRQMQRLAVTPGLTGLGQISGRADISFEESVDLDLQYIRTRSIRSNLRIILLTIPKVIKGDGAY